MRARKILLWLGVPAISENGCADHWGIASWHRRIGKTGWIDLDWASWKHKSATPSRPYIGELKDSNKYFPVISRQRGQER